MHDVQLADDCMLLQDNLAMSAIRFLTALAKSVHSKLFSDDSTLKQVQPFSTSVWPHPVLWPAWKLLLQKPLTRAVFIFAMLTMQSGGMLLSWCVRRCRRDVGLQYSGWVCSSGYTNVGDVQRTVTRD